MPNAHPTGSKLKRALKLWEDLTGVGMASESWRFGDYSVREMNEELKESLKLDPTEVSSYLLLECFLREYLEQKKFTAAEIIKDYDGLTKYLAKAHELFDIVQSDDVVEMNAGFRRRLIETIQKYGIDQPKVVDLVNNLDALPFLRRDALRSMESLKPYQFLSGANDPMPPQAIGKVYQAWNTNDLLVAVRDLPVSGVALTLLKDPAHPDRSYFTFVMRNGGNVIIFTDKTKWATPVQADLMRRPDRNFANRAWQNHFPYQMVKHHHNEKGDVIFDKDQSPVAFGLNLVPLMDIGSLPAHQVVWIVMMLSLVVDKFWTKAWRAPALSYTAGMIQSRDKLVSDHTGALLPIAEGYQKIALVDLSVADVSRSSIVEQIERATHYNSWLEDRYIDRVSLDVINHWQHPEGKLMQLPAAGHGNEIAFAATNEHRWSTDPKPYDLRGLSPTEFGTEAEIKADQVWLGRYNMAKQIQKLADEEYAERKAEISAWWANQIKSNQEGLFRFIASGQCMADCDIDRFNSARTGTKENQNKLTNILQMADWKDRDYWHYALTTGVILGRYNHSSGWLCYLNETAATYRIRFSPRKVSNLALLGGCDISDLPDVLQNWTYEKPYTGNNILDRLDPIETELHDPWMKLNLDVNIFLSKRALTKIKNGFAPKEPI